MILNKNELLEIDGGAFFSGTMISALTKAFNVILDLGRSVGTAIRRISKGRIC